MTWDRDRVLNEPSAEEARAKRFPWNRSVKKALLVCLVALVLHLLLLLLPRNMPEQELSIARAIPDSAKRVTLLKPLKEHPKATGANLREAAELLREGSPMDAYELTRAAESKEPGSVETQLLLARICHGQRMKRCEEESLKRAGFHERDGDVDGALMAVEEAYRKAPGREGVAVRYARLLSATSRGEAAMRVLETQAPLLGKPRLWVEQGLVRVAQGRLEEGRRLFARAVEEDPKLAPAYYHLGLTAFRLGDIESAEEALREADRLDMTSMRALSALCAIQRQTGRVNDMMVTRMDLERRFPEKLGAVQSACGTR